MAITYNQNGIALIQLVNYCHIDFANSLRMKIVSQSLAKHKQLIKKQTNDMKTKIFALFAAMMLLMGTTVMAQNDNTKTTETELKGDVNGDGIVDVADIAAVIAVMHEQGTVKQQYYWYVGQENPASIDTKNLKENSNEAGWHLIGTSTDDFTLTFNNQNLIEFEDEGKYYLIIPTSLNVYAADGFTPLEGKSLLPIECKILNHKAYEYYTSVYEVKGLVIK